MALPQPSLRLGGGAPWATKAGNLLAHQYDEALGVYKPIPIGATRNSGGWRINKNGLWEKQPDNYPRIMFDENANGDLITEPQRINGLSRPIDFSNNTDWAKEGLTLTGGHSSPDGKNNAYLFTEDTSTGAHRVIEGSNRTFNVGEKAAPKIHLKYNGSVRYIQFIIGTVISDPTLLDRSIIIDIQNGTIQQDTSYEATAKITSLADGWYEVSFVMDAPSATVQNRYYFSALDNSLNNSYTGSTSNSFYAYFAQIEENADYSTTLIDGTRAADVVEQDGLADFIGQSEGWFFVRLKCFDWDGGSARITLSGTGANDRIVIYAPSNILSVFAEVNGVNKPKINGPTAQVNTDLLIACTWRDGSLVFSVNGTDYPEETSMSVNWGDPLQTLRLGNSTGSGPCYGRYHSIGVGDEYLSIAQINELTTNGLPALP